MAGRVLLISVGVAMDKWINGPEYADCHQDCCQVEFAQGSVVTTLPTRVLNKEQQVRMRLLPYDIE